MDTREVCNLNRQFLFRQSHVDQSKTKVLSELPASITNGTILIVEDLQQELTCNINVKHREEFDVEKEPDEMLLLGWNQALPAEKDDNRVVNGVSTSTEWPSEEVVDDDVEMEISDVTPTKKRKVADTPVESDSKRKKVEEVNDDDKDEDIIMIDGNNLETRNKRELV